MPQAFETKRNDPFDYKLRSLKEVKEQLAFHTPDLHVNASYKRYTAGDYRQGDENNIDDRDRISKLKFDLRDLHLAPLQRERFIFLLGPRWNPKKPHDIKIVTKQYATFLENYFKGMGTIQELYYEALRAPADPVNLVRDPYLREKFIKKKFGRTKEERKATLRRLKREKARFMAEKEQANLEEVK